MTGREFLDLDEDEQRAHVEDLVKPLYTASIKAWQPWDDQPDRVGFVTMSWLLFRQEAEENPDRELRYPENLTRLRSQELRGQARRHGIGHDN